MNWPGFVGVSLAAASVAPIETVVVSLSAIVTVALLGEPTVTLALLVRHQRHRSPSHCLASISVSFTIPLTSIVAVVCVARIVTVPANAV